jgi:hypothetical protein
MNEFIKITNVEPLPDMHVRLTFDDGVVKIIDVGKIVRNSVFEETFKNPGFFKAVKIEEDGRGIVWPNDFDLCPDSLRYYTEGVIEEAAIERSTA